MNWFIQLKDIDLYEIIIIINLLDIKYVLVARNQIQYKSKMQKIKYFKF